MEVVGTSNLWLGPGDQCNLGHLHPIPSHSIYEAWQAEEICFWTEGLYEPLILDVYLKLTKPLHPLFNWSNCSELIVRNWWHFLLTAPNGHLCTSIAKVLEIKAHRATKRSRGGHWGCLSQKLKGACALAVGLWPRGNWSQSLFVPHHMQLRFHLRLHLLPTLLPLSAVLRIGQWEAGNHGKERQEAKTRCCECMF